MCEGDVLGVALLACALASPACGAFVVDDPSFFAGKPSTFLDFETRGDGSPVGLGFLEGEFFESDEYAIQGLHFANGRFGWDTVPPPSIGSPLDPEGLGGLGDAVDAIGTTPTVLFGSDGFEIHFLGEVHAFGIGVVQNGFPAPYEPSEAGSTMISAFDSSGGVIGSVRLWGDLIDVQFGNLWAGGLFGEDFKEFQAGFLGLASETPIAFIRFDEPSGALYDHLHFSSIPSPGPGAPLGLLTLGALARRRR